MSNSNSSDSLCCSMFFFELYVVCKSSYDNFLHKKNFHIDSFLLWWRRRRRKIFHFPCLFLALFEEEWFLLFHIDKNAEKNDKCANFSILPTQKMMRKWNEEVDFLQDFRLYSPQVANFCVFSNNFLLSFSDVVWCCCCWFFIVVPLMKNVDDSSKRTTLRWLNFANFNYPTFEKLRSLLTFWSIDRSMKTIIRQWRRTENSRN